MGMIDGRTIAEERKRLGLSQTAFAEKIGVSRGAVHLWETNRGKPAGRRLRAVTDFLGIEPGTVQTPRYERPAQLLGHVAVHRAILCVSLRAPWCFRVTDEIVDMVRLPPRMNYRADLKLFTVPTDVMAPRYFPGETVLIGNSRMPSDGDFVVVMRRNSEDRDLDAAIGRLIRTSDATLEIEQYNPAEHYKIARRDIEEVWRIIPQSELF